MDYGYFNDQDKTYVIKTPYTPYPWINYLGSTDYFVLFSNTAGGYSFYKDAKERRITRFRYNNVPVDNEGRYFYIKDETDVWNIGARPTNTPLDFYEAKVGLGYTIISSRKNQIYATQKAFVPLGFTGEVQQITLKNEGETTKTISLYSYVEFALWDAYDDMTNFQRNYSCGEVFVDKNSIYHITEYRERRNHYAFVHVNQDIDSFDTDRDAFLGMYRDVKNPIGIESNELSNSIADGWHPCAATKLSITLKPNEEKQLIYLIGYVENIPEEKYIDGKINQTKAKEMINQMSTSKQVDDAFENLRVYWEHRLSNYQIKSNDPRLDRMVNIWNQYQTATTYNLSRSASYFESGVGRGMGFRDSNQDLLGFMHMDYNKTRERILDLASTLLRDGGAYHQYSPLTKKGNTLLGTGFNDDPNWLILSVCEYIKESGDFQILDEVIPYESNLLYTGTLKEHLDLCFDKVSLNLGSHGLPLIGRADWNDCLNLNCFSSEPGESFQTVQNKGDGKVAESIFIAGLFVYATKPYVELLNRLGLHDEAFLKQQVINKMTEAVVKHGYDESWFLRAYDAYGQKVGSKENTFGKIFIEPQGMCVMAGIGLEDGKALKALNSAWTHLGTNHGMVLNYPAYQTYDIKLGEISSYPPGYKENGGIFCHNNPWVMIAETVLGRNEQAYRLYKQIAPALIEDQTKLHKTEPYVYSQMIAGKETKNHGEAKNSWLTGTSAWNFVAIAKYILGIRPNYDGLIIDPKLPDEIKELEVKRVVRGVTYHICVLRGPKKGLYIDDKYISYHEIPYELTKKDIYVKAYI